MSGDYFGYRTWKGWAGDEFGQCPPHQARYFDAELARSGIASVRGLSVFEVGFGNGQFASWSKSAGATYTGSESIGALVQQARNAGFNAIDACNPDLLPFAPGELDLVVAFDVFEHMDLATLRAILASMSVALKPEGRLLARVPSGDSPFSGAIQHGDLTHRMVLGSSTVAQLAAGAGFEVHSVREPAFPLRGLGWTTFLRRAAIQACRRIAYPLVTLMFMGGGQPVLTPNMVFVLVKP